MWPRPSDLEAVALVEAVLAAEVWGVLQRAPRALPQARLDRPLERQDLPQVRWGMQLAMQRAVLAQPPVE
jgi:hypothetical protein